jgi:hypothetical protein
VEKELLEEILKIHKKIGQINTTQNKLWKSTGILGHRNRLQTGRVKFVMYEHIKKYLMICH